MTIFGDLGRRLAEPKLLLYYCNLHTALGFNPFQAGPPTLEPWTPFASFPMEEYMGRRTTYSTYLTVGMSAKAVEVGLKAILRNLCILFPHRTGSTYGPSGVWNLHLY